MQTNSYEITNPVFNTAKMTSFFLSESGNKYAKAIVERTCFDSELAYKSNPLMKIMLLPNMIGQDVRYEAINRLVRLSGCKNILDLACGFSPRGLEMAAEGYTYHGGDLQMVVPVIEPIIKELAGKDADKISYYVVDVTDYNSCMAAAETLDGPVAIITEGLMTYLNDAEKKTVFENMAAILKKKGGIYVCPDFNGNDKAFALCKILLGEDALSAVIKTQEQFVKNGDCEATARVLRPDEVADNILKTLPLKYEMAELFPETEDVMSYKAVESEKLPLLKKEIASGVMLIAQYDKSKDKGAPEAGKDVPFTVKCREDGNNLNITVSGRMDSITSPAVVDEFAKLSGNRKFDNVSFDFSELSYISSAGLRVVLSIKKSISGDVTVDGANADVKQVFGMTGFDNVVTIK